MSEHGVITGPGTLRFERLLPGPIERVWSYLTESEFRGKWLATGEMDLRPGGRVELHFRHENLSPTKEPVPEKFRKYEAGASCYGRVVRCDPPRLLTHTWDEEGAEPSEVTYELSARVDGVLLVLTHRRLGSNAMRSVSGGWHTHLGILADQLSGRTPRPFWSTYVRLETEYLERLGLDGHEK